MTSAKAAKSPFGELVEFFTLRHASALSARLNDATRTEISNALALGRQKSDAAETLWSNGHSAEGLRLAMVSLEATLAAAPAYARALRLVPDAVPAAVPTAVSAEVRESEPGSDTVTPDEAAAGEAPADAPAPPLADEQTTRAAALRDRGATAQEIARIEDALRAARNVELPALDAEIAPAHTSLYETVMDARRVADRRFAVAAQTTRQVAITRVSRIVTAIVTTVAVLGGTYFATRQPEYSVAASSVWASSADFQPERAVDGRENTWWLLPDGEQGWLEVRFTAPRRIEHVRLTNTTNGGHMDRGTHEYRVEIYSGGRVARTLEGSFDFVPSPTPVSHDVGLDDVQRIRFVVLSHHRSSAGLTELAWD